MASASTVDLSTADGFYVNITGTTTITGLGTESAGVHYLLKFAGILTLTHNATSLILPGGASITTGAGDVAWMISEGSGNWRCAFYSPATPTIPQVSKSAAYTTVLSDAGRHILHPASDTNARTFTIDSNANVPYALGTAITFINETSQVVTIAITSDTLTLAGTTSTGSRSLAQNGIATAIKKTTTSWLISGIGLT
jgi:hypothetical protein